MCDAIRYLNTDLDLTSAGDLTRLAAAFDAQTLRPLHVDRRDDGLWYATFETGEPYDEPHANIAAIIAVVESLPGTLFAAWEGCVRRELNVGYDCGSTPRAVDHGISSHLLGRLAGLGVSLRITLYGSGSDSDVKPPA